MFEQEVKDFIAAEVVAKGLISADLTGVNETSFTAEARGHILNATNQVEEKWFYFYKEDGNIIYKELIKLEKPQNSPRFM